MNTSTKIGNLELKNPFIAASGTYGYGVEYTDLSPADRWGAVILKSVSPKPRPGNVPPRCCETDCGMINSIGLANEGLEVYMKEKIPAFRKAFPGATCIASLAGETLEEFLLLAEKLSEMPEIKAFELNISCPNVAKGGMHFGADRNASCQLVRECKKISKVPVWVKVTPSTTDPVGVAAACAEAGADAVVATNTIPAMKIDVRRCRPVLGNIFGGLSGPAIFTASLRIAYLIHRALPELPLIGCGGVDCGEKAVQFILAGCSAVEIGTATFRNPGTEQLCLEYLEKYMAEMKFGSIEDFRALAHRTN